MEKCQDDSTRVFPFLKLPPELRLKIFRYLLVRDQNSTEPRHPQILPTSRLIYNEAFYEWQKNDFVQFNLRGHGLDNGLTTLAIGSSVKLSIHTDHRPESVVPPLQILESLPHGINNIQRIKLNLEVPDSSRQCSASINAQFDFVLAALASVFTHEERTEVHFDDRELRKNGWTTLETQYLLFPLSRVRPLLPNPEPGASHYYAPTNRSELFDMLHAFPIVEQKVNDVVNLLKRTGLKPQGVPCLERRLEAVSQEMYVPANWKCLSSCWTGDGLDTIENILESPQVRRLREQAELVLKTEKALSN